MSIPFSGDAWKRDIHLFELYHENSKLNDVAPPAQISAEEIFISARSTRADTGGLPRILLPETAPTPFDRTLRNRRSERNLASPLGVTELASLLDAGAGVTGTMQDGDGPTFVLRAAPSAGALYAIDSYVIARDVDGLDAGVYYFHPHCHALLRLPNTSTSRIGARAFFSEAWIVEASAIILLVAAFNRLSWKYGERSYRLCLLDAGHIAQNILLKATDIGCSACALGGFHDDAVAAELGLDGVTEAAIHAIALGRRTDAIPAER